MVPNAPVPVPRTFNVTEFETAAYLNSVRDALNFLLNPPIAVVYDAASQSVGNNTFTPMVCDSTTWDTYGGHSNTTNNSRYTAQVAGFYALFGSVAFGPNATGFRGIALYKNSVALANPSYETFVAAASGTNGVNIQATGQVQLNAGDFVECYIYQSSGGALSLAAGASGFSTTWIHV